MGAGHTYLSEMAPPKQRGFYASFIFATLSIGQLLALAVLGHRDGALYDGSWAEWGGREDAPVATGP